MLRRVLPAVLMAFATACGVGEGSDMSNLGVLRQRLAVYDYQAADTASATVATADFGIFIEAGETVMLGTCGITESASSGDTFLRLFDPSGTEVALSDDACAGLGSRLSFTSPVSAQYELRAGCFSSRSCSGTVAISRLRRQFDYAATNTGNALINTFNKQFYANGGDTVVISTCGSELPGAAVTSGDTYLRLYTQGGGALLAENDDGELDCGTASLIRYEIQVAGYYQIRAGCFDNGACEANIVVYIE